MDDAFISFRYADHVASGLGYVFNPGERVEGASNLLWVLLLAAGRLLGAAPLPTSQVLGSFAALAALFFQLGLSTRLSGGRPSPIGPWLTALSVPFALWSVAGLETIAYSCAITGATLAALRDLERNRAGPWPAMCYLAVAALRPEGAMFAIPYLGLCLARATARRSLTREALVPFAVFGGGIAAITIWRWLTFESLVPNTFFAKVNWGPGWTPAAGVSYLWRWCATGAGLAIPLALLSFAGKGRREARFLFWSTVVLQAGFVVAVGGDWMPAFRFVIPVLPIIHVLAGAGISSLWDRVVHVPTRPAVATAGAILVMGLTLAASANDLRRQLDAVERYALGLTQGHEALGRWLHGAAPPGTVMAIGDCGAVPYYSDLRTIDLFGLTHRRIARLTAEQSAQLVLHELRPELIVLAIRPVDEEPDYLGFAKFPIDEAISRDTLFFRDWSLAGRWPFMARNYDLFLFVRNGVPLAPTPPEYRVD